MKLPFNTPLFLFLSPISFSYHSFSPTLFFSFSLSLPVLLILSFFPSLSLRLDEIDNSSSLNQQTCSVFADWLAGTKKIHWYVLAKSHYRFSILVVGFVLFWGLAKFFFFDYDLGISFCYWLLWYVLIWVFNSSCWVCDIQIMSMVRIF